MSDIEILLAASTHSPAYIHQITMDRPIEDDVDFLNQCKIKIDPSHPIEKTTVNSDLIHQILENRLINERFFVGGRITPSFIETAVRNLLNFSDNGFYLNVFNNNIDNLDPNIGFIGEIYHYLAIVVLAEYYNFGLNIEGTSYIRNLLNLFPEFKENIYEKLKEGDPHLSRKPFLTEEDYLEFQADPGYFLEDIHESDHLDYLFYRPQVSDALNSGHVYDYFDYFDLGVKERIYVIKIIQSVSKFINVFLHDRNKAEGDCFELTEEEYQLRQYIADNLEEFLKVILNLSGLFESLDWKSIQRSNGGEIKIMAEPPLSINLQLGRTTMQSFKAPVEIVYKDHTDNARITKRPLYAEFKQIVIEMFGSEGIIFDDDKKIVRFPFSIDFLKMQSSNRPDLLVFKSIEGQTHIEIIDYKRTMPTIDDDGTDFSVLLYKLNAAVLLVNGGYRRPKDNFSFSIDDFYNEEDESYDEDIITAIIDRIRFFYFDIRTGERKEELVNLTRKNIYKILNTLRLIQEVKITYTETIKQILNTPEQDLLDFDKPN